MSFCLLFAVIAVSTLAGIIPVYNDSDRNMMVDVHGDLGPHRVVFVAFSRTFRGELSRQQSSEEYQDLSISLLLEDGHSAFTYWSDEHEIHHTDLHHQSTLGVGPGGHFQRAAGSVSVVHFDNQASALILGISDDEFSENYCLPESSMRIPLFETGGMGPGLSRMSPFGSIQIEGSRRLPSIVEIDLSDTINLLSLPYVMMLDLFVPLGIRTVVGDNERVRFDDCREMIRRLPFIDIGFSQNRESQDTIGTLHLSPEDYVRNLGGDTCELLVVSGPTWMVWFNPLLLSGFNIRTTRDHLTICDSL